MEPERRDEFPNGRRSIEKCRNFNPITGECDLNNMWKALDKKLDGWIFKAFLASVTVIMVIAGGLFSWLLLEAYEDKGHITVLTVNQQRLMNFFEIDSVKKVEEAKEIMEKEINEDN
jgi:hypothetical protein